MDNNVISILENYKNQWTDPAILTSGISYDTEYNIRKVTRYMNSLFMGSSKFSNGLDKIFYNITISKEHPLWMFFMFYLYTKNTCFNSNKSR